MLSLRPENWEKICLHIVSSYKLENEYAVFWPIDLPYMVYLKEVFESNDIDSLIFTSDNSWNGFRGTPPGVLLTVNFQTEPEENLETLREIQPDKPLMVMEFWSGWYDYWFGEHNIIPAERNKSSIKLTRINHKFRLLSI